MALTRKRRAMIASVPDTMLSQLIDHAHGLQVTLEVIAMPSTDDVIETHWIDAREATAVAVEARRLAGLKPGVNTVSQALLQAASERRVTLTPNHIALARATDAALRIDGHMEAFRLDGTLD